MKKLTDEEIIKVLECCGKEYSCEKCILNTWLNKKRDCVGKILGNALDLINSQKAEIERLQQKNSELESDLILKTYDYEHLLMKCKELQAISSSRKDRLMQIVVKLQTAKSEARKEFAERVYRFLCKEKNWRILKVSWLINGECEWLKSNIDNLLKEMEGEDN